MSSANLVVYIIDDDEDIRSSLSRALGKRGYSVETFASANDFLEGYTSDFRGCILLDQGMPGMTGLELQEVLVQKGQPLPIIFITGHGGVPESVQAIKAGAIDFLEKPFRSEVLIDRIETAFDTFKRTNAARTRAIAAKERLAALTSREQEIVSLIVSDQSNLTSKEIARTLDISSRTVDHHRARILEKVQSKSIVELIKLWNTAQQG